MRQGLLVARFALLAASWPLIVAPSLAGDLDRASPPPCPAARVHGDRVTAGPFVGLIARPYDVLDGGFRLRVGGMRDDTLSQKIAWLVAQRYEVGSHLRVSGRRRDGNAVFRARFALASSEDARGRWVFPSILDPPSPGCWRLRFRSGEARGSLWVRVTPAPR